jgi:hypothetical protein
MDAKRLKVEHPCSQNLKKAKKIVIPFPTRDWAIDIHDEDSANTWIRFASLGAGRIPKYIETEIERVQQRNWES